MNEDSPMGDEVMLIVSGHFTPDAVGPDVYAQTIERVRASPTAYLDAFETLLPQLLATNPGTLELQIPDLLRITQEELPERSRDIARRLLQGVGAELQRADEALDAEAVPSDEARRVHDELQRQREMLEALM